MRCVRTCLDTSVLHADETPLAVLSPGAGRTHRAYLWAYRSGPQAAQSAVVFDFRMSRAGQHAQQFLQDYQGALMVDDHAGYKALFESGSIIELACLAHVRRKFFELFAANKSLVASQALETIARLYQIEWQAIDPGAPERQALRMSAAKPVLAGLADRNARPRARQQRHGEGHRLRAQTFSGADPLPRRRDLSDRQ